MINTLPKSLLEAAASHTTHIDVDGELKHRFTSEGKAIHHTDAGIQNFHRWFGNSQTVDTTGRPKVVYHGTNSDVDQFSRVDGGNMWGHGHYFSESKQDASAYATGFHNRITPTGNAAPNVVPAFLKMNNPFVMDAPLHNDTKKKIASHIKENLDDYTWAGMKNRDIRQVLHQQFTGSQEQANGILQKIGYDGISEKSTTASANGATIHMVFHPNQIKSAMGNNGEFTNKPTIHESPIDRPFTQDEHGKNIVHDNGTYKISVNDPHDAEYIALWHSGKAVGKMYLGHGRTADTKGYATVRLIDIDKKHQGKGMGKQMYKTAMTYTHAKYKGIGSEHPDRANKKQVPAIFRKMGGKEHQSGDFTVDRQQPLQESTNPVTFRQDNPGGDWLASKQRWAEEDMAKRGGKGYVGKGITGATTGYFNKPVNLPVSHLINLPGAEGEEAFRGNSDNQKMDHLKNEIGHPDNFDSEKHPIFIAVNHKGDSCVMEGNHRLTYAHQNGIKHIHTEVRYYNGGEDVNGHMHPAVLQALHK